jgi:large subunit ribosomal protein L25
MKTVAMFGYKRNNLGKSSTKAVRAAGQVPCVLYGGQEHLHFTMYEADFKLLVYTPNTYKVQLDIDGTVLKAVLKDIQYHPVNESIIHADFMELNENKEIEIPIPVKCVGNSVGVRQGGKLMIKQQKLRVKGLPGNLPESIEINIDSLEIGKSIKVADITVNNIVLLDSPNNPVVTVKTTRAAVSAATEDAKGAKKK